MAPVDPTDLLKAFKPLLTTLGGIKSKSEVPRLSMLMKKYSKKLVSRCIYCNILHATTPDLLQTFLEQDGWNLINAWIKDSLNGNNFPFLCELLDLLDKCPMTVERLKTNDTPKLIKNLAKSSDKDVSAKARIVVTKWTGLVHKTNENINNGNLNRKKRKKEKSIDDEESDSTKLRKVKGGAVLQQQASVDDTAVTSSSTGDTAYKPTSTTRPRTGEDVTSNDGDNTGSKTEKRPSTAKISYGKARSLGILEDINAGPGKSKSSNKKGDDPQSTSDKSGPGNKNNKLNSKSVDNSVSVSSSGQPTQAKTVATKPIHTLKESVGFIEDIANISSFTGRVRKRRKSDSKTKPATTTGITATKDTGQAENSNNGDEPGTGQDPMDIEDSDEMDEERAASAASAVSGDDSNSNAGNSNNNNNNFNNNNENSNSNNNDDNALPFVDVPEIDNLVIPEIDASKLSGAIKSILNYGRQSGKSKKSVKWRAEDRLREIRYFELDETERTNVTKQGNFGDFRSIDIKNERQMMQQLRNKGNTPAAPVPSGSAAATPSAEKMVTYLPWRLLPIDLPQGLPLIEAGCQSEERRIQAEAARNCFNSDFFPVKEMEYGFPKEPDLLEPSINNDGPRTIPLEDENLTVTDYSQLPPPQPRTGESYPANRGVPPGPGPGPALGGPSAPVPGPYPISGMAPRPPAGYIPRPPHPPAGFVPPVSGYAPYGGGPYTPPVQQAPPRMVPPRPGPPPGFQPPGGAWPPRPRPPPICRNFLKTGNCRFMARCNYLHQYPNNPHGSTPASSSSQPHME